MKSDIMAHANLWGWAVAALCIFVAVFAAQAWRAYHPRNRQAHDRAAALPFDDGTLSTDQHHAKEN